MFETRTIAVAAKPEFYQELYRQLAALLEGERDPIAKSGIERVAALYGAVEVDHAADGIVTHQRNEELGAVDHSDCS